MHRLALSATRSTIRASHRILQGYLPSGRQSILWMSVISRNLLIYVDVNYLYVTDSLASTASL